MKRGVKSVSAINALAGVLATTSLIALAPIAHAATSAPGKSCAASALGVQASYKDAKEGQQTLTCGRLGKKYLWVITKVTVPANLDSKYIKITGDTSTGAVLGKPKGEPPTSLFSADIVKGGGATVAAGASVTVHYTLMAWSTGKIVESSWTSGQPASFPLSGVIKGWQDGIPGMREGGRRLLIVPPALGYGATATGPIAANETLVFVVDLIKVG
jgi:peptidylprolyl isomerase